MAESNDFSQTQDATNDAIANFAHDEQSLKRKITNLLHNYPAIVPFVVLLGAVIVFSLVVGERFFSPFTLTLILQQVAIVGIVASAQSLIILTAGIDLSVGAIMVLSSVIMGKLSFDYGIPAEFAIVTGLLVGLLIGTVNGILVAKVKLPPFIVTLGMWQIALAINFLYSGSEVIRSQDIARDAPLLQYFGNTIQLGGAVFTYGVILLLILFVILCIQSSSITKLDCRSFLTCFCMPYKARANSSLSTIRCVPVKFCISSMNTFLFRVVLL